MITIAKRIFSLLALAFSTVAFAQIPVSVTTDATAISNQIQTLAQWASQYQQMVGQINQMKAQFEAITGNRNLGQIQNNPALRNYLPDQWAGVYSQVGSGQLSGISSIANSIAKAENFDPNATGGKKRQQDVLAANKAMTMQAYDATLARLNNINALMQQANATQDAKGAADLANRMAAENAMIQNEQIRLNQLAQLQIMESNLADKQHEREFNNKHIK